MDWTEALELFCRDSIKLSPNTLMNYKWHIRDFFLFCPKNPDQINDTDVVEWYNDLKSRYKLSYVDQKLLHLRIFYNYLNEENIVFANPANGMRMHIDHELRMKEPISKEEYKLLINATKHNIKHQVILAILYTGGLRLNELVKLKISDIEWDRAILLVNDDKKLKQREVLVTYDCLIRLRTYLETRNDDSVYIFPSPMKTGQPLSRIAVQKFINSYMKCLGFTKQLSPQVFRFTYASNLWAAGFDIDEIAKLMGHECIGITKKYIACFDTHLQQIHQTYYH